VFRRSSCPYPRPLLRPHEAGGLPGHIELVDKHGFLRWHRSRLFIGEALAFERVAIWPTEGSRWEVFFGPICLGYFDPDRPTAGFLPRRRPRNHSMRLSLADEQVSGMSLD